MQIRLVHMILIEQGTINKWRDTFENQVWWLANLNDLKIISEKDKNTMVRLSWNMLGCQQFLCPWL